jgi:hypothetical protein
MFSHNREHFIVNCLNVFGGATFPRPPSCIGGDPTRTVDRTEVTVENGLAAAASDLR